MLSMVPNDLQVEAIASTNSTTLYAARRLDVWYFVVERVDPDNPNKWHISQVHISRCIVAVEAV
jgi:hypothetical protein